MALSSLFVSLPLPLPKLPSTSKSSRFLPIRASSAAATASPSFDLRRYWTSLISEVEGELDAAMPIRPPESIHNAIRHAVFPGAGKEGAAKRAPPVLCVAACELLGAPRAAALPTAAALEMLHAASLVHDDLPCFDAAPTRRGRPSTHAAYGTDMAVLAGDALFPLAYTHVISHTPSPGEPFFLADFGCRFSSPGWSWRRGGGGENGLALADVRPSPTGHGGEGARRCMAARRPLLWKKGDVPVASDSSTKAASPSLLWPAAGAGRGWAIWRLLWRKWRPIEAARNGSSS